MPKMTFEFLDVGMGDGSFIMMGDSEDTMQLAMVDFGVHRRTKDKVGRDDALKYLVSQIDRISKARDRLTPYLDHLFITHPDHDHYNAVMPLIEAPYPSYDGKKLQIGRLTYGGDEDLYKGEIEKIAFHVANKSPRLKNIDKLTSLECSTVNANG
jgi:competence protein ComEC